jgi:phosphoenolpyruvate carboxykinase (GTP)
MTAATVPVPGLDQAPTQHRRLQKWVREVVELTTPDDVIWCDGSATEWQRLTRQLIDAGTFVRLAENSEPNSFWCASDPADVARGEDSTFIGSTHEIDAGPTNDWMDAAAMKQRLNEVYRGCMHGRVMYVLPFCMGPLTAEDPKLGVQITDSASVVTSVHIVTRMGTAALTQLGRDVEFVPCRHSVGAPLEPGERNVAWPCNTTKYVTHFPETRVP